MKKIPLLPRYFRWIGLILFLLSLGYYVITLVRGGDLSLSFSLNTFVLINDFPAKESVYFGMDDVDFGLTLFLLVMMLGLTFMAFSGNKVEDEMISSLRLYSWSWAILSTVVINFVGTLFIFGWSFMSFLALLLPVLLLTFIIIFWTNILLMNRRLGNEE